MRGKPRALSLRRRLIVDMMHAASRVPFVGLRRTLSIGPLLEARATSAWPPGFAAIFAKAFCLVARDEPVLRTLYIGRPFAHFYELPRSVGMIAIARRDDGEDCVLPQKLTAADEMPLIEADRTIRCAATARIDDVPMFRKLLRIAALPRPLRRILWAVGLNLGRTRANFAGSFGISSVSAVGPGDLEPISPGPYLLTYGRVADGKIDVLLRWDHRVTDAAFIARVLSQLEQVLNGAIADELRGVTPSGALTLSPCR